MVDFFEDLAFSVDFALFSRNTFGGGFITGLETVRDSVRRRAYAEKYPRSCLGPRVLLTPKAIIPALSLRRSVVKFEFGRGTPRGTTSASDP